MESATRPEQPSERHGWRAAAVAARRVALLAVVALVGAGVGWALAPSTTTYLGPLEVEVDVVPSLEAGVQVDLPPVGKVHFDTHAVPVAVEASVQSVDLDQAELLVSSPQGLLALQLSAPQVMKDAALSAVAWSAGCAVLGALLAGLLVYRARRQVLETTAMAVTGLVLLGAGTTATFDAAALRQPRFTGLLSRAPYVAGEGRAMAQRLESYRSGLADFVQGVTTLYAVSDRLPVLPREQGGTTTVLHISDIHLNPLGFDLADQLVEQFGADVVVDTGDITTWGSAMESSTLSRIGELGVPYLFVRGNHDSAGTEAAVAAQPGAVVLDGDVHEVAGLTFAGIGHPVFTPSGEADEEGEGHLEVVGEATEALAKVVEGHPPGPTGRGVDVALLHDPGRLDALFGDVPLVLAGHYHRRIARVDEASGTRVMVQGTTGGAGLSQRGLQRLQDGQPLPLTATLLHFAVSGDRAGQLVAYDEVTVGGLGLQSVTVERTSVPAPDAPSAPGASPPDTPTQSATP